MAIAHSPGLVVDCPDPAVLARFYAALLGWTAKVEDDWAEIRGQHPNEALFFQKVDQVYTSPRWPGQDVPQQMHLDVIVDNLDAAEAATLALGATKAERQPGETFRVLLDPAGHPFCLCVS